MTLEEFLERYQSAQNGGDFIDLDHDLGDGQWLLWWLAAAPYERVVCLDSGEPMWLDTPERLWYFVNHYAGAWRGWSHIENKP